MVGRWWHRWRHWWRTMTTRYSNSVWEFQAAVRPLYTALGMSCQMTTSLQSWTSLTLQTDPQGCHVGARWWDHSRTLQVLSSGLQPAFHSSFLAYLLFRHSKVLSKEIRCEVCSSFWPFSQYCVHFRPYSVGFLDDVTLGGPRTTVSSNVSLFRIEGTKLGLNVNVSKCEVISLDQRPFWGAHQGFYQNQPFRCCSPGCTLRLALRPRSRSRGQMLRSTYCHRPSQEHCHSWQPHSVILI